MPNKYYKAISEIKASDELKEKIRQNALNQENIKENIEIKGGIMMKIKNKVATIIAIVTALLCGGVAFATILNRVPQDEDTGIKFSENYIEYEEVVENGPTIEKDGTIIELKSKVADEGFIVLKFNVKLSEGQTAGENDLLLLSFNDKLLTDKGYEELPLGGANYNLIIDGKSYFIRPGSNQQIIPIIEQKEYEVYQMWLLTNEVKDKENFKITLDNIIAQVGNEYVTFKDKLEIDLSKEKTAKDTTKIDGNDAKIEYKKMTQKINNIKVTPLQTIVDMTELIKEASEESLTNTEHEDSINGIYFKVYDQNGEELTTYNCARESKIKYEDGTIEEISEPYGFDFSRKDFENAQYRTQRYLAIEGKTGVTKIEIEVFEVYDVENKATFIGVYTIDLNTKTIKFENKNEEAMKSAIVGYSTSESLSEEPILENNENVVNLVDME